MKYFYNPDAGNIKTLYKAMPESEPKAIISIHPDRASGGDYGL